MNEKQSKADAFWQAKYVEEKEREHMHAIKEEAEESPQYRFSKHSHFDSWDHYKHDYIDSLPPHKSIEQELEGEWFFVRTLSCSFKYRMNISCTRSSKIHIVLIFNNDNLADLRQQAAHFKALAITEVVGHALAEEALQEAEQRAESCEIAEAVLLGAAADK